MPDSHPEIDKYRPGKQFVKTYLPEWDWYNTESAARTVADKAQEVIDALVADLHDTKTELGELRAYLQELGRDQE